jgi:sialate O-acetylesterase
MGEAGDRVTVGCRETGAPPRRPMAHGKSRCRAPGRRSVHAQRPGGAERREIHDVLFGDVWLASGQSNMEWEVAQANDARPRSRTRTIRSFDNSRIPISWSNTPERELTGGAWTAADPAHVGRFTAVGYFFARELRKSVPVPIGIINSTWGGSAIETWMSRGAQHLSDSAWAALSPRRRERQTAIREKLRAKLGELPERDAGLTRRARRGPRPT